MSDIPNYLIVDDYFEPRPNKPEPSPIPESGSRMMKLPPNASYPGYLGIHPEDDWCSVAGCSPACASEIAAEKAESQPPVQPVACKNCGDLAKRDPAHTFCPQCSPEAQPTGKEPLRECGKCGVKYIPGVIGHICSRIVEQSAPVHSQARELAKELVYSVRGWGQRSPEFMTTMVGKWQEKIEAHAAQQSAELRDRIEELEERVEVVRLEHNKRVAERDDLKRQREEASLGANIRTAEINHWKARTEKAEQDLARLREKVKE